MNIDIAPTILSLAGVEIPSNDQGRNLLEMTLKKSEKREDFFYEHTYLGSPRLPKVEGVVSRDFKYMKYIEHDYEELYDTKNDPHEATNLAKDESYKAKLDQLRQRYEVLKESAK